MLNKEFFKEKLNIFLSFFKNKWNAFLDIFKKYVVEEKKVKNKWLVFILIVLIFVCWVLFFWWLTNHKRSDKKNVENSNPTEIVADEEESKEVNVDEVANPKTEQKDEKGLIISFENLGNFWLEINTEKVKIKAPIVEGVAPERLDQGIGHHKTTAFPSKEKGNVVLSGHNWFPGFEKYPARRVFFDLDKLEIGENVELNYKGEKFVYKIVEKKIVEDTEVDILDQTIKPQITLYTCTPKYVDTTKRLVFIGELVK